jgi:hypothetical protein
MELSPSGVAASYSAIQEFHNILWHPKIHYHVHKSTPLVSRLNHIKPVQTIPSWLSNININIIVPPTSRPSKAALSSWLSQWNTTYIPVLPMHATFPANLIILELIILIVLGVPPLVLNMSNNFLHMLWPCCKVWCHVYTSSFSLDRWCYLPIR